jgi:hypothetical protein
MSPQDPLKTLVQRLRDYWLSTGVAMQPGATAEEIANFESRYGVHLPSDMRYYVSTVNGMGHGVMDDDMLSLWPLHSFKPLPDYFAMYYGSGGTRALQSYFVFADFMIFAHAFAIRLTGDPDEQNPVVWISCIPVDTSNPLAVSFSEFIEIYLTSPDKLLCPPNSELPTMRLRRTLDNAE